MDWRRLLGRGDDWSPESRNRVLEGLTRSVAMVTDFAELRALITQRFRDIAKCETVLFCEYHHVQSAYLVTAVDGGEIDEFADVAVRTDGALVKWLQVNEETLSIPDERGAHTYLDPDERDLVARHHVRAVVPLLSVNRLVGLMMLVSKAERRFSRGEASFLATCGHHAGLSCEAVGRHAEELDRTRSVQRAQQLAVAGQLAATIAHEVRSPLTVIRSTLQYALSSQQPWSEKQQWLEDIVTEVDRIDHTADGLLSLSRPPQLDREVLDLTDVAERAIHLVTAYAESHSVTLTASFGTRPLVVTGDVRELRQVFVNVLLNACQAVAAGGEVVLRSSVVSRPRPDGRDDLAAVIEVADNGAGMSADVVANVFDPFFTTKKSGTGLGLPICLEIVNRHEGEIRLSSEPGQGTVATVLLPLRKDG